MYTSVMEINKHEDLRKSLSDTLVGHQQELRETMRNVALVSGAIAVGALVILGSKASIHASLVLIGIIILLIETALILFYLLHAHTGHINEVNEGLYALKLIEKRGEDKAAFDKALDYLQGLVSRIDKKNLKPTNWPIHWYEIVAGSFMVTGLLMIILGLVIRPICSTWGFGCI